VKVKVRLYSILRDYAGSDTVDVEVAGEARVSDLLDALSKRNPGFSRALEAVGKDNLLVLDEEGKRLSVEDTLSPGVVHIMPPPEGGGTVDAKILGPGDRVSLDALLQRALEAGGNTGAFLVFVGVVRRENLGGQVSVLHYEDAGEISQREIERVAREVAEKYRLNFAAAYHYTGPRMPGDLTMIIAVAGESRKNTYPALEELVDRVKREVPLWKKEVHEDGAEYYIVGGRPIRRS